MAGRVFFGFDGTLEESPLLALTRSLVVAPDRCWLCAEYLNADSPATRDHVFMSWVQEQLGLRQEKFYLSNGSRIAFAKAVVPCCRTCNQEHLSRIENRVRIAYRGGVEGIRALDKIDLFIWLAKLHYGLLRLELRLPRNRGSREQGTLQRVERFVGLLKLEHLLLQAARGLIEFSRTPSSILIFELEPSGGKNFDYVDRSDPPFLAVRLGQIGLVANLVDWGWLEEVWPHGPCASSPQPFDPTEWIRVASVAKVFAERLRGGPDVHFTPTNAGRFRVDVAAEMNAGVAAAASGVALPPGFRPDYSQWWVQPGLIALGNEYAAALELRGHPLAAPVRQQLNAMLPDPLWRVAPPRG